MNRAFRAFIVSLILLAGVSFYALVQSLKTADQVTEITRVVGMATCGGGSAPANLAACHRLCPNLATISNLKCDRKKKGGDAVQPPAQGH